MKIKNIMSVVKKKMCIGCGMCELICPKDAINIVYNNGTYQPKIIQIKCNNCGYCLDICYGNHIDYLPNSNILGIFFNTYFGFSSNKLLRFNSSSGGIVPSILEFLFDNKLITGAIVSKLRLGKIPFAHSVCIEEKKQIADSIGSKYCPVLYSEALKNLKNDGIYAIVGLPCQIYSVKKLIEKKKIKIKILITIGIICGGVPSYNGTRYLIKKNKLKNTKIKEIQYRGNGWPGSLKIISERNKFSLPYLEYWPIISPWFILKRCETCYRGLNISADISCGDAWIESILKNDIHGTSIIASRTEIGDKILTNTEINGYIKIQPIEVSKFIQSQKLMINSKFKRFNYDLEGLRIKIGKFLAYREKTWLLFRIFTISSRIFITFFSAFRSFATSKNSKNK